MLSDVYDEGKGRRYVFSFSCQGDLDVSPSIVLWVMALLRDRPQTVCVNSVKSNELILNTGAPQGCVLSPILFSIYTNEIMSNTTTLTLIKFADDIALVACLKDEQSLSSYFNFIGHLISWLDESYLKLYVKKTKELFIEEHIVRGLLVDNLPPPRDFMRQVFSVKVSHGAFT